MFLKYYCYNTVHDTNPQVEEGKLKINNKEYKLSPAADLLSDNNQHRRNQ